MNRSAPTTDRRRALVVFLLLLGSLIASGCGRAPKESALPDIFLITVDTLRANHLGCYGYSWNTTPNIDAFAGEALLFEQCRSHASETRASFSSVLSGFLPHETKVIENIPLVPQIDSLPEILQARGYTTIAVVSNYVLRKGSGFDQGFDVFDDTMKERELVRKWPERMADATADRAIALIEEYRDEPLFVWIHFQDPHGPYLPPDGYKEMFRDPDRKPFVLKANESESGKGGIPAYNLLEEERDFYRYVAHYDGEIRFLDEQFGRVVDALDSLGLIDNALVVFTADHAEGMGENNYFFGHGENLYDSVTHVPLIVKKRGAISGRRTLTGRRTEFVQHLDIVPTVLNVAGVDTDPRFRGADLLAESAAPREIFAVANPLPSGDLRYSLVSDGFKLIHTPALDLYELFDLKTDPFEEKNLFSTEPHRNRADGLAARLAEIRKDDRLGLRVKAMPRDLSDEEKEKLKALGYFR